MPEQEPATVARFSGTVTCGRSSRGPLGLTLTGRSADAEGEEIEVAFAGAAASDLPGRLEDALIERVGPEEYRVASAGRLCTIAARSVHVHREIADAFYRAIPPRPAPLGRRVLYGVMLRLAGSRAGMALIRALRR